MGCNHPSGDKTGPLVSVLMPTYRQDVFISRAIESLLSQTLSSWELLIINDGSPDKTDDIVSTYIIDNRIRYYRFGNNRGIGAALNFALHHARGSYIAYLPSDDLYYPKHLETLAKRLDTDPEIYLMYGGVVSHHTVLGWSGPTLQGAAVVDHELAGLDGTIAKDHSSPQPTSNNILAPVQVMHRRSLESQVRWTPRSECVTDYLEANYWRSLLTAGAEFKFTGETTCEWTDHPDQHHKIIAMGLRSSRSTFLPGAQAGRGLTGYRTYYRVPANEPLNWRSSNNLSLDVDEARLYARLLVKPTPMPTHEGIRILIVGSLGMNPERIRALTEIGHELFGLWIQFPAVWDYAGAPPCVPVTNIPYDSSWRDRVREANPDIIYCMLSHHDLPLIDEVLTSKLGIPTAFHFKESPFMAMRNGQWGMLRRVLTQSDGHIFISDENYEWFRLNFPGVVGDKPTLILDGDLPKIDWMTNDFSPRLSGTDGEIHTTIVGRPVGMDELERYTDIGVHIHVYGTRFRGTSFEHQLPSWVKRTQRLHLHPAVTAADWVSELSRYDAAWSHISRSFNYGDLRAASWSDLNMPARLGTYAAAGLPVILKDNRPSITAVQNLVERLGIGVPFSDPNDLRARLLDSESMTRLQKNVRQVRTELSFDVHTPTLTKFLQSLMC
jgi:glycosyl transferase family 2